MRSNIRICINKYFMYRYCWSELDNNKVIFFDIFGLEIVIIFVVSILWMFVIRCYLVVDSC